MTSILIGVAIDEGLISSLDQNLGESFPQYRVDMTPQISASTIRPLLSMTAGLPGSGTDRQKLFDPLEIHGSYGYGWWPIEEAGRSAYAAVGSLARSSSCFTIC